MPPASSTRTVSRARCSPGRRGSGLAVFPFQVLLNMNSSCNCRCSWCDATQLAKVTENPSGRARLRQLLRRLVALGRIDEQLYGQCFEAEFGRLPQHRADADHVEDVSSDDAACAAELEKNVGVGHADLEDAHPPADGSAFQETQARGMNTDEIRGECGKGDKAAEVELPDIRTALTPTARVRPHNRRAPVPGQSRCQAELRLLQRRASLGHTGLPCIAGGRARVQPSRGQPSALRLHLHARKSLMLRKLWALDTQITQAALDRIRTWEGEEAAATYAAAARSPSITRARRQPAVAGTEWPNLLARRRPALRLLDPGSKKAQRFDDEVRRDRRLARRKVFFPDNLFKPASVEQEIAEVEEMQALCGASSRCGSQQHRPALSQRCNSPNGGGMVQAGLVGDVPEVRFHAAAAFAARRDIDVGAFQRAQYGYRIHSSRKDRASARQAPARDRCQELQVLLRPPLRLLGASWSGLAGEAAKIAAPLSRRGRFGVRALAAPVLAARSL